MDCGSLHNAVVDLAASRAILGAPVRFHRDLTPRKVGWSCVDLGEHLAKNVASALLRPESADFGRQFLLRAICSSVYNRRQ
jgi:hypothetical protein